MAKQKKIKRIRNVLWGIAIGLAILVGVGGYIGYREFFFPNVKVPDKAKPFYLYIPTGSDFEDVLHIMESQNMLLHPKNFEWAARKMHYADNNVKPGKYLIKPSMSNKDLIMLLRSGKQTPVQLVFNNIRTKAELSERVGQQIEAKPYAILNLMDDNDYINKLGFKSENILSMFLPNTYEIWWNTSPDQFMKRMKKEYDKYWTVARRNKAKEIGFTPVEISVLASIIQKETNRDDEKNIIAGIYINRYKQGMHLEADPTLVYALGDYSITRVLNVYKNIDSPYNTYKYAGLPPGPICLPTQQSIDAVLNYTHHRYMYFCARDDFSGYHAYAVTYEQHQLNARRFQKELNRRRIMN
jgi:UPF0755 protein